MGKIETKKGGRNMGGRGQSGADKPRPLVAVLLGTLLFLLPLFAGVAGVSAAEDEAKVDACNLGLTKESLNKIIDTYRRLGRSKREERNPRRELQRGLEAVFRDNPEFRDEFENTPLLVDGIIGPETLRWLQSFCREFPVSGSPESVPENVVRFALHYAEIEATHPTWEQTVTSPEFDTWVRAPPPDGHINTRQIRRSGAAPVVIRLLDDYLAARDLKAGKAAGGAVDASCQRLLATGKDNQISERYLKSETIGRKVTRGLQAVFAGNPRYQSELKGAPLPLDLRMGTETRKWLERFCRDFPVSGSPEKVPDSVVRSALHYAEIAAARPDWRAVLTDSGFNQWVRAQVPEGQTPNRQLRLSGSAPIVIKLLDEYPGKVVPSPQPAGDACPPATAQGAAVYYELSEEDLGLLKGHADFVSQVEKLMGKEFATKEKLDEAIDSTADLLKVECVRKKFLNTIAAYKQMVPAPENGKASYKITAKAEDVLNGDPLFFAFRDNVLEDLKSLLGVAYVNDRLYQTAVCSVLKRSSGAETECAGEPNKWDEQLRQRVRAVATQARKEGQAEAPLPLNAADCGCARQWDSVRGGRFIVYGFYPYWIADRDDPKTAPGGDDCSSGQADGGAAVDFSVLSRIGYYALELNEMGDIENTKSYKLWKDGAANFIGTAHKYLSKVDVVIEARDWKSFEDSAIDHAVKSISNLLSPEHSPKPKMPDGVTIYFPDFPDSSPKEQRNIVKLVRELSENLGKQQGGLRKKLQNLLDAREAKKAFSVNILLDAGDLTYQSPIASQGEGKLMHGLREILQDEVDLALLFLRSPVTDMKKGLRLAVEKEFEGENRTKVLRKIVPVIPPNGHEGDTKKPTACAIPPNSDDPYWQLQHDLVYFRDNFRGVAFWPVPTARDQCLADLKRRLVCTFAQSEAPGQFLEKLVPGVCDSVCPKRTAFGIAFSVLLGLLLLLALLAYWSCRVRNALAKRYLYILGGVALLTAIFVALITCDPIWNEQELNILGVLVALLIGSWLFHYIRKVRQGPLP